MLRSPVEVGSASRARFWHRLRLFKNRLVVLGMLAVGIFFVSQFALFTYLRPFLGTVTRGVVATLSLTLLTLDVEGFAGTTVIGRFLKLGFDGTPTILPLLMTAITVALVAFGASPSFTAVLLRIWGLVATAPLGWWLWIARILPKHAEAGGGLMLAIVQLTIAHGSTVGGLLFDHSGGQSTLAFSAGLLLVGAFFVVLTVRADRATS